MYQFPECDSDEDEEFKQLDKELKVSLGTHIPVSYWHTVPAATDSDHHISYLTNTWRKKCKPYGFHPCRVEQTTSSGFSEYCKTVAFYWIITSIWTLWFKTNMRSFQIFQHTVTVFLNRWIMLSFIWYVTFSGQVQKTKQTSCSLEDYSLQLKTLGK